MCLQAAGLQIYVQTYCVQIFLFFNNLYAPIELGLDVFNKQCPYAICFDVSMTSIWSTLEENMILFLTESLILNYMLWSH